MRLSSMDPDAGRPAPAEVVAVFRRLGTDITIRIWGGDWCPDTRNQLPDFAATLAAAGVPEHTVEVIPVDRNKQGRLVDAYDVTQVPTIVIEQAGTERARFVEAASEPPAAVLAKQLAELDPK